MRREPMRWGTNEMGDQWVGGTNDMGGPMEWVVHGCYLGDQWEGGGGGRWVGGPVRWGTNEMGDKWDGGPLGLADDGVTYEKGDQWDGGPARLGTNEMGYQWVTIKCWGPMSWGTIEKGTKEMGANERGDQWADPVDSWWQQINSCAANGWVYTSANWNLNYNNYCCRFHMLGNW